MAETVSVENETVKQKKEPYDYKYIFFIGILIILVCFVIWHVYCCFCENRDLECSEDYINGSPRTDPQFDEAFDVGREVKKLIQLQEEYLEKLQRFRLGN